MRLAARLAVLSLGLSLLLGCGSSEARDSLLYVPEEQAPLPWSLAKRKQTRAYDGAPPVIPHSLGRLQCRSCHDPGAPTNGERVGPPRSHPAWGDCRQCHVVRHKVGGFAASDFEPLWRPARGERLYAGAPPMIPHQLQNRDNCPVCHIGPQAPKALRAGHGIRDNCVQCHAAGAE